MSRRRKQHRSSRFLVVRRSKLMLGFFLLLVLLLLGWFIWQMLGSSALPTGLFLQLDPLAAPPRISAQSAVLIEAGSGRILYEHRADDALPVASLTKMMTVALALEIGDAKEMVTVSDSVLTVEPVLIGLVPGERLSLTDLEASALIHSGNDAALMLAEHLAGDEALFVEWMTERAREIGCRKTVYKNAHGLDQEGHISTALDQAKVARYALSDPRFADWARSESYRLRGERTAWNLNKLLDEMPGATGIKIGFTDNAGRCLAASAEREGRQLIAVVLNAPDWFDDAQKLLEYGFSMSLGQRVPAGSELQRLHYDGEEYLLCAAAEQQIPLLKGEWFNLRLQVPFSALAEYRLHNAVVPAYLDAFGLEGYPIELKLR